MRPAVHPTRTFRCLGCHKSLNSASSYDGTKERQPKPGDATICIDCGHLMVIGEDMWPRNPNREEQIKFAGDKDILAAQRMLGEFKRWKEHQ